MPRKRPIPPQKPLLKYEKKARAYIRKTPEYIALLKLGLNDVSETFWSDDKETLWYKGDTLGITFQTQYLINQTPHLSTTLWEPLVYGIYDMSFESYNDIKSYSEDITRSCRWKRRNFKKYKMQFYKQVKGIRFAMKRFHKIYKKQLIEWSGGNANMHELINIDISKLPLYIDCNWGSSMKNDFFKQLLKNSRTILEYENAT